MKRARIEEVSLLPRAVHLLTTNSANLGIKCSILADQKPEPARRYKDAKSVFSLAVNKLHHLVFIDVASAIGSQTITRQGLLIPFRACQTGSLKSFLLANSYET